MELRDVVPWGRNLEEYRAMFALDDGELERPILGCGDGPSSFNAQVTKSGGNVVSIDPVYGFAKEEIARRIRETAVTVLEQVAQNEGAYVWKEIGSLAGLERVRMAAMAEFLEDYDRGRAQGRYVEASLPHLPFGDGAFALVLCSHFLFLYGDRFDLEFHLAAVSEMCRVGNEVRIFPLLDLKGEPSRHLKPLREHLERNGWSCSVETVGYEFQKGADAMLRVRKTREGERL